MVVTGWEGQIRGMGGGGGCGWVVAVVVWVGGGGLEEPDQARS